MENETKETKDFQMKTLKPWSRECREVKRLLKTSFPKEEQYPMWQLFRWSREKTGDFLVFLDDDRMIGFTMCFHTEKMFFCLYLATNPKLRSNGYGSAIVKALAKRFEGLEGTFHIEAPDDPAPNREQRLRRLKFYERLGYHYTGYSFMDDSRYWIISDRGSDFDKDAYLELFSIVSGGHFVPELQRIERKDI